LLIALTLMFSGVQVLGASAAENRFKAAAGNFRLGLWSVAAKDFAEFVRKYPDSPRVPEAILYQAEALINQADAAATNRQFAGAIELLSANQFRAGPLADQYLFWIGQAHLKNSDYPAAANAFERLLSNFPASSNRFDSVMGAAVARAKLEQWPRVIRLLQDTNGVFQQTARVAPASDAVANGYLLLGEAQLAQTNYSGGYAVLASLDPSRLKPALAWRRYYLQSRLQLAEDHPGDAWVNTTNLISLAREANDPRLQAETAVLEATILERLNLLEDAVNAWQRNLTNFGVPPEQESFALLKVAELSLELNQPAAAIQKLERYLERPAPSAADLAILTIGELQLRQYFTGAGTNRPGSATNLLKQAAERFDVVLNTYTNSPWTGRALLDKGWYFWTSEQYPQSEEAFRLAAGKLPFSEDQAVARFKWADAQFKQKEFAGAVSNYNFIVTNYADLPGVQERLLELALYQTVRAGVEAGNVVAGEALQKILKWYPDGFAGDRALLLVGEGRSRQNDPAGARRLFADFETRYPSSPWLPELRLAIARTYEREENWPAAIAAYESWIGTFTNSTELPRAEFCLAIATSRAGFETNALTRLTNFVARFPEDERAATAQWWVGAYYYGHGDYYNAERVYQDLFKNWKSSDLACEARMMAGRAAMARFSYKDAIGYFTDLYNSPACGVGLKIEAAFGAGDAFLARTDAADATNRIANLGEALDWFERVVRSYPTNAQTPFAYLKIGNCNLQWAATDPQKYVAASSAYQQVLTLSNAIPAARYQARIALATVAEKQAALKTGDEQAALLSFALSNCLEVLNGSYEPEGERPDPHAVMEAGLRAGGLAEKMNLWTQAVNIYTNLAGLLPALRPTFEKRAQRAQEHIVN
jgi:TolA-binding protein